MQVNTEWQKMVNMLKNKHFLRDIKEFYFHNGYDDSILSKTCIIELKTIFIWMLASVLI